MDKRIIRLGIAGLGWIVEKSHIPSFEKIDCVEIVSIFDISEERRKYIAEKFHIRKQYSEYLEFLQSGIDAVVIATPNYTHAQYSIQALENGIHVLCEKPIALISKEVRQAIKEAENNNCLYIPAFVNRFRYDIQKLKECVDKGKIGEIISINAGWLRRAGMPRPGSWFTNKKYSGGGVLSDLGPHVLDICLMLLKDKMNLKNSIVKIFYSEEDSNAGADWFKTAEKKDLPIDVEDTVIGEVYFEEEILLKFAVSWCAPTKGDCTYFVIKGTKGKVILHTLFGYSNDRLWDKNNLVIEDVYGNREKVVLDEFLNTSDEAFYNQAQAFVNQIQGDSKGELSAIEAFKNVSFIETLYDCAMIESPTLKNVQLGSGQFE